MMAVFDGKALRDDIVETMLGGETDLETSRYLDRLVELATLEQAELDIMSRRDHIGRDEDDSEGTQRGYLRTVVRVDCAEHRQQHTQRGEGGSAGEGGDGQLHLKTHRCHLRGAVSAHSQRSAAPSR